MKISMICPRVGDELEMRNEYGVLPQRLLAGNSSAGSGSLGTLLSNLLPNVMRPSPPVPLPPIFVAER